MEKIYFVLVDGPAGRVKVSERDADDIWTPDNLDGWTYQEVEAPFSSIREQFDTREEAEKRAARYREYFANH
jgi:hypothetical protein